MQINPARLIADLRALAGYGQHQTGVNRVAFSAVDIAAREWLCRQLAGLGMSATLDTVGNVYGRMNGVDKAVLIGSHSDTVPFGGWLDGAMGVIYGLEIARCVAEAGNMPLGIDVVSFQDEEGTYRALLGSRVFCGEDVSADIAAAKNAEGVALKTVMSAAGLAGKPSPKLDPKRHVAYLEGHIEQGPRLEHAKLQIGVVTAIVGLKTFRVVFKGEANHAGTTPMAMRHDAGAAALSFGAGLGDVVARHGNAETVWNVGKAHFEPGAPNVVPHTAELTVQFRDAAQPVLDALARAVLAAAEAAALRHRVTVEVTGLLDTPPAAMHPTLIDLFGKAAHDLGASTMMLPSGAGHDAMVVARYIPSGMVFVPSIGGRSHHVAENTDERDIVRGAEVMLRTVEMLMAQGGAL